MRCWRSASASSRSARSRRGRSRAIRSRACSGCREHDAVINRLGFNNDGVDALVRNVERAQRRGGLLGINIGKNKDTPNESAEDDYLFCLERVYPLADYVTVNISSPNTAGLRELQEEQALRRLVGTLREAQERLGAQHGKRVPMLVKVAPDLSDDDIDAAGRVLGDLRRRRRDRDQHHDRRGSPCSSIRTRTKPAACPAHR